MASIQSKGLTNPIFLFFMLLLFDNDGNHVDEMLFFMLIIFLALFRSDLLHVHHHQHKHHG